MLNGIKSIIQEKTAFRENAELLLEDTMPNGVLDDAIILGEETNDFDFDALIEAGEEPEVDMDDVDTESDEDVDNDTEEPYEEPDGDEVPGGEPDDEDDIMNASIDDADTDNAARNPEPIDTGVDGTETDIMNQPIDGDDTLPTPIGAQTGEPINDNNDILSMTIDIGSNTPSDILPVPPASAADAVPDDSDNVMNQHVDSGFGGESDEHVDDVDDITESAAYDDANSVTTINDPVVKDVMEILIDTCSNTMNSSKLFKEPTVGDKIKNATKTVAKKTIASTKFATAGSDKAIKLYLVTHALLNPRRLIYYIDSWNNNQHEFGKVSNYVSKNILMNLEAKHNISVKNVKDALATINSYDKNKIDDTIKQTAIKILNSAIHHLKSQGYTESVDSDEDDVKTEAFCQFIQDMRQKAFMEEISLGGDDSAPTDDTIEAPAEDTSSEASADTTSDVAPPEEESPVTTAVKDKVAEADAADAVTTAPTGNMQQEIMNRLSNITKNLEDVKKSIMQSMQSM